jgi:hypothetical protein
LPPSAASLYDSDLRLVIMLTRMENLATVALRFVDRDTENHLNRGSDPILGAADLNTEARQVFQLTRSSCGAGGRLMC